MKFQSLILVVGLASLVFAASGGGQRKGEPSKAAKLFARAKPDDYMGSEACAACHAVQAKDFHTSGHASFMTGSHLPLDKQGCEGCHGPGGIHQDEDNPENINFRTLAPAESSAACLRCHASTLSETHWKRSAHSRENMACVSCHQIHPDSDPAWETGSVRKGRAGKSVAAAFKARVEPRSLLKADQATLCGQCHGAQVAEFRLNSHHPIPEGRMQCSDCHNAHPTKNSKLNVSADRDACVTCHADLAGPFVFEHDPVAGYAGAGCAECHSGHGSHNAKMLKASSRGLCAQCHTEKLAEHNPGRSCWSAGCHVAPHGSNTDPTFRRK